MEGFPGHLIYLVALLAVVIFFFARFRPSLNKMVFSIGVWIAVGLGIAVLYLLYQEFWTP